jgi:hypothetical protein
MEEPKQEAQPIVGEYRGKPIIRIPTVDNPNLETTKPYGMERVWQISRLYHIMKQRVFIRQNNLYIDLNL